MMSYLLCSSGGEKRRTTDRLTSCIEEANWRNEVCAGSNRLQGGTDMQKAKKRGWMCIMRKEATDTISR